MSEDYFEAVSKSENPVYYYHEEDSRDGVPAEGIAHTKEITDHIEKHIGPIEMVYHEVVSELVHLDVHYIKPNESFPFHTMVTSGMSDRPMNVHGHNINPHMELSIHLPSYWQVSMDSFKDERWYWPVRMLKFAARFPHLYDTCLGYGHTVSNGNPPEPFDESVGFNGLIILPSIIMGEEFFTLEVDDEIEIQFYSAIPIYDEEMVLKLRKGCDALLDKFDKYDYTGVIDPDRKNFAAKRFGFF